MVINKQVHGQATLPDNYRETSQKRTIGLYVEWASGHFVLSLTYKSIQCCRRYMRKSWKNDFHDFVPNDTLILDIVSYGVCLF